MTPLLLGLALLAPPTTQEDAPQASSVPQGVRADAEFTPRIHPIPLDTSVQEMDRAIQVMGDPMASAAERRAAHAVYREALELGTLLVRASALAEVVTFILEPEFEGAPFELSAVEGARGLLAIATDAQHLAIAEVLGELKGDRRMIDIEASIIAIDATELETVTGGRTALSMTGKELAALKERLAERDRVSTPRVLVFAGQPASITTGREHAYIKDFEITVSTDLAREIVDPTVGVVFEGIELGIRAAPRNGKLRVAVDFTSSQVETPFPEKVLRIGPQKADVTVQVPEVTTIAASALFDLEEDAAIVLGAMDTSGETDEAALVILTATLLESEGR